MEGLTCKHWKGVVKLLSSSNHTQYHWFFWHWFFSLTQVDSDENCTAVAILSLVRLINHHVTRLWARPAKKPCHLLSQDLGWSCDNDVISWCYHHICRSYAQYVSNMYCMHTYMLMANLTPVPVDLKHVWYLPGFDVSWTAYRYIYIYAHIAYSTYCIYMIAQLCTYIYIHITY